MKTAQVTKCEVENCAYNSNRICRAVAITVGNGQPSCETYCHFLMNTKAGQTDSVANVGACKISACIHNTCLECQADRIEIAYSGNTPICKTFAESYQIQNGREPVCSRKSDSEKTSDAPEIFIG